MCTSGAALSQFRLPALKSRARLNLDAARRTKRPAEAEKTPAFRMYKSGVLSGNVCGTRPPEPTGAILNPPQRALGRPAAERLASPPVRLKLPPRLRGVLAALIRCVAVLLPAHSASRFEAQQQREIMQPRSCLINDSMLMHSRRGACLKHSTFLEVEVLNTAPRSQVPLPLRGGLRLGARGDAMIPGLGPCARGSVDGVHQAQPRRAAGGLRDRARQSLLAGEELVGTQTRIPRAQPSHLPMG
jgi:hypothetical protein